MGEKLSTIPPEDYSDSSHEVLDSVNDETDNTSGEQVFMNASEMFKGKFREFSSVATELADTSTEAGLSDDTTLEELSVNRQEQVGDSQDSLTAERGREVFENRELLGASGRLKERVHALKDRAAGRVRRLYVGVVNAAAAPKAAWLNMAYNRAETALEKKQQRVEDAEFVAAKRIHEQSVGDAQQEVAIRKKRLDAHKSERQTRVDASQEYSDDRESQREAYVQQLVSKKEQALARKEMRKSLRSEKVGLKARGEFVSQLKPQQLESLGRAAILHETARRHGRDSQELKDLEAAKQDAIADTYDQIEEDRNRSQDVAPTVSAEKSATETPEDHDATQVIDTAPDEAADSAAEKAEGDSQNTAENTKDTKKQTKESQQEQRAREAENRRQEKEAERKHEEVMREDFDFSKAFGGEGVKMIYEGKSFGHWVDRNREAYDSFLPSHQGYLEDIWANVKDRIIRDGEK